ncbi:MAG: histidine kinase dimerization/phospho-acceptor domain-containing protein [Geobacteraceae bacterium]|nr:histidine kinase dimerization/phospho-acceptor domain-containing protein [Geobacteraceae bacterium]
MKFRLSIRVKLFLSILLAILVSYVILLFLTIRQLEASLDEKITRDLETNLGFVRYHFHAGASQISSSLLVSVSRPKVKQYLKKRDSDELSGVLISIVKALPFLQFADFVEPDGKVLVSYGKWRSGYRHALDYLVKEAERKREPIISYEKAPPGLLVQGRSTDPDTIVTTVVIPVADDLGETVGALVAGVSISRDIVIPYQIRKTIGHDLEVMVTTSRLKVSGEGGEKFYLPASSKEAIIPVLSSGSTYTGEVRIDNLPYQAAFEPIRNFKGELVGSLSVAISKEYLNRMRGQYLGNMVASGVFGILLAFGIAFVASRRLSIPLRELSLGVKCIESGNLDYRVQVAGNDEFSILANSFNSMAEALQDRNRTINSKTIDLEVLNRCLHEMNELLETKVLERTSELQMEKGRLEAILASMVEGVVVTDRDNRVIVFNSAAQKIFGIAPYKMISRSVDEIDVKGGFHQLILSIRDMRTGDLLAGGEKEVSIGRKKLRVSLSPLLDQLWEFAGIVMSVRDVTHEDEIARMKTEFISTVSHELKTPLTSMKGSLQFILGRETGLKETERELLEVCFRNTNRLVKLITDILDISRMESGRFDLRLKPAAVNRLVSSAMEEVAEFAAGHGVEILNDCEEGLPNVLCDGERLIQVLTNLLSNAVQNTPAGKSVTVSDAKDGCFVRISVRDRGKVIERGARDKLFQNFFQFHGPGEREWRDSGLGLVICREIMERHHGRIQYQPGKEGGNIFSISIPISEEPA